MRKVLFSLCFLSSVAAQEIAVVGTPFDVQAISQTLCEKNISLTETKPSEDRDDLSYVVFFEKPSSETLQKFSKKKLLFFHTDPKELPQKDFRRIYTWNDDLVDDKKVFKFYFPALRPMEKDPHPEMKFTRCYEEAKDLPGYITGKIFDCFATGTVPIYWGASNVSDYIPKNCFIDRRNFATEEDVEKYIQSLGEADYQTYLKNIRDYLASDKAKLFSQEMFDIIFLEAVRFP